MSSSNLWRRRIIIIVSVEFFVGGQEWDVGLHSSLSHITQGNRFGCFPGEGLDALLHPEDFIRMGVSEVVLFVRIFGDVVELDVGGKYRFPDELPIALTQRRTERFDIIDNLSAG